jgi:hypothetical protein
MEKKFVGKEFFNRVWKQQETKKRVVSMTARLGCGGQAVAKLCTPVNKTIYINILFHIK